LVYSDKEQWFLEEAREGNPIAIKGLNSQPAIEPCNRFFWVAFWELTADRQIGAMGGVGVIPFGAIDAYARRFGVVDPDDFRRLLRVIRKLDDVYVKHVNKKG
jgi:hypothetical protein